MNRSPEFILLAWLLFFQNPQALSKTTITLGKIIDTPDHYVGGELLRAAYEHLGIEVKFNVMPAARSLVESSTGHVDGEIQRIYEIQQHHPTLIRVPTPFNSIDITAFSQKYNFAVKGWESLKGYRIGRVRGIKFMELGLASFDQNKIHTVKSAGQLPKLTLSRRIDFYAIAKVNGVVQLKKNGIKAIHFLSPPLASIKMYHYLHKKNAFLVPKIDGVFKKMIKSGELEKLRKKIIKQLFNAKRDEIKPLVP